MYYAEETINELKRSQQIAVFGAGIMALGVINCLIAAPYQFSIRCCLVSDKTKNPESVLGIPVCDFTEAQQNYSLSKDATVVIASIGKGLESMESSLHRHGYFHLIALTYEGDLWSLIRGNYYREQRLDQGKPYRILAEELLQISHRNDFEHSLEKQSSKTIRIYTVRSHVDKRLKEDVSQYFWEVPIQAGAAMTDQQICDIRDNTGENISYKNHQYCELTALYWIWKNDHSDYVGLGHYRRHFEVDEWMLEQLAGSDIDVVLTIPIFDFPSVKEVYWRDHVKEDWLIMMEAIQKISPVYMDAARMMQDGKFYYAYNMFIMRREILDDYCAWLFPILDYCEVHCREKEDRYQNRYIGFLAEHLMSIYFFYHEDEYKIAHATKHFIEG